MCTYAIYEEAVTGMSASKTYIIFHCNITCNSCLFYVCSFSRGQNCSTEQGLSVMLNGE